MDDEEGGRIYLRLRGVLGKARFADNFEVVVSLLAKIRLVSGLMSLSGDDDSSSEVLVIARRSFRKFLFGDSVMFVWSRLEYAVKASKI